MGALANAWRIFNWVICGVTMFWSIADFNVVAYLFDFIQIEVETIFLNVVWRREKREISNTGFAIDVSMDEGITTWENCGTPTKN